MNTLDRTNVESNFSGVMLRHNIRVDENVKSELERSDGAARLTDSVDSTVSLTSTESSDIEGITRTNYWRRTVKGIFLSSALSISSRTRKANMEKEKEKEKEKERVVEIEKGFVSMTRELRSSRSEPSEKIHALGPEHQQKDLPQKLREKKKASPLLSSLQATPITTTTSTTLPTTPAIVSSTPISTFSLPTLPLNSSFSERFSNYLQVIQSVLELISSVDLAQGKITTTPSVNNKNDSTIPVDDSDDNSSTISPTIKLPVKSGRKPKLKRERTRERAKEKEREREKEKSEANELPITESRSRPSRSIVQASNNKAVHQARVVVNPVPNSAASPIVTKTSPSSSHAKSSSSSSSSVKQPTNNVPSLRLSSTRSRVTAMIPSPVITPTATPVTKKKPVAVATTTKSKAGRKPDSQISQTSQTSQTPQTPQTPQNNQKQ